MNIQAKLLFLCAISVATLAACGDDESTNPDTGTNDAGPNDSGVSDSGMPDSGMPDSGVPDSGVPGDPPPPSLGATVIDRKGRPAINTALIAPLGDDPGKGLAKDEYNANGTPSTWAAFAGQMAASLAVYDALDATCGNQLLAGANPVAGRYDTLAGLLADDRIYVNSNSGTCTRYLGVELSATVDCGGRAPSYDVIDVTYSVLATGMSTGVGDGVATNEITQSDTAFPFFAP